MNNPLSKLQPEKIWFYFNEILQIPRPSKKEERIAAYLIDFAKKHNLEAKQDEIGNVYIAKNASKGFENRQTVVLQSHLDMVCEKNSDKNHDFDIDAIQARIEGEWVKANGTTLGGDDGIGIAASLAILASDNIDHGPIECLFTVDEETGLTGAFALSTDLLKGKILLNLDSEDEGEIFIGCAGGKDTVAELPYSTISTPLNNIAFKVSISGLSGGHSGDDINKGLGNANKLLNRFLWETNNKYSIYLAEINGGNLRNAIPREAYAIFTIAKENEVVLKTDAKKYNDIIRFEYRSTESELKFSIENIEIPDLVIESKIQSDLLNALYACPHGVISMSREIPNFVETSTNLASVKMKDKKIIITTSQRSSVESAKEDICNMVASVFHLIGATVTQGDGYPGWTPNPDSVVLEIAKKSYIHLFNKEPKVLAIHAGLECGLIGEKYPEMDMISYGPTIKGAHSPDERMKIDTVQMFWELTLDILKNIPKIS
ncbi:MAG: aminoacyl-histidine dipeptidase [Bacteroidales bacterium]